MTKTFSALAAAAAIAVVTAAPVQARDCVGCGVAAGLLGGFALGAIAAGAAAPPPPPPPEYVAPVRGPRCWTEPRGPQHWDGYAWVQPTVRVCR
jgi:hypothetical protein